MSRLENGRPPKRRGANIVGGGVALTMTALMLGFGVTLGAEDIKGAPTSKPVMIESIEGSNLKRVILSKRAAERLGIRTDRVREDVLLRKQMVSGLVLVPSPEMLAAPVTAPAPGPAAPGSAAPAPAMGALASAPKPSFVMGSAPSTPSFVMAPSASPAPAAAAPAPAPSMPMVALPATAPAALPARSKLRGGTWVRISLSERELSRVALDQAVRIVSTGPDGQARNWVLAQPTGLPPASDGRRASLSLYYMVDGAEHGFIPGRRVRVELPLNGSGSALKVVPYGAIVYDAAGQSWVYANPAPLVYVREKVEVEDIEGDQAALSSGPAVGTPVVTVGSILLYGAETQAK